jgi:hypothetical protein
MDAQVGSFSSYTLWLKLYQPNVPLNRLKSPFDPKLG